MVLQKNRQNKRNTRSSIINVNSLLDSHETKRFCFKIKKIANY